MSLETVTVDDNIQRLKLNRPDSLNALNRDLLSNLVETIRTADGKYQVLIIEGNGDAFTAGADLEEEESAGDLFQEITEAVRSFDGIVIGKVHGWVVGGGFEWTLSFDLCYADEETKFMMPESEIGVTITNGSSLLLPLSVGRGKARELIFTGRTFDAKEAMDLGLLAGVYKGDELDKKVLEVAQEIVEEKSSVALRLNKCALNHAFDVSAVMEQEELINEYCHELEEIDW